MQNRIKALSVMIEKYELALKAISDMKEQDPTCNLYDKWILLTDSKLKTLKALLLLEEESQHRWMLGLEKILNNLIEMELEKEKESYQGIPIGSYDDMAKAYSEEDANADYERELYRQAHIAGDE